MKMKHRYAASISEVRDGQPADNILLYKNGECRLGNKTYAAGIPLDSDEFEPGCYVTRRLDEPQFIFIRERGKNGHRRTFEYRGRYSGWYEYTPLNDPGFIADMNRYGEFGAQVKRKLCRFAEVMIATVQTVIFLLCVWGLLYGVGLLVGK